MPLDFGVKQILDRVEVALHGGLETSARYLHVCFGHAYMLAPFQPSSTVRSRRRRRAGSARMSSSVILPARTVQPMTENGCPSLVATAPIAPLTSAGRTTGRCGSTQGTAGDGLRAPHQLHDASAALGPQDDVRIEHRDKPLEVALPRGRQEGLDHLTLGADVGIGVRGCGPHPPAGAAGKLTHGLGRAIDDRGDLVEGDREHVVQHERESLGRRQRLEHDQQRQSDGIGQQGLVLGVRAVRRVHDRIGDVLADRLLTPRPARAQHVQRHARDHGRQPPGQILDLAGLRTAQAQPSLLDGVVRLAQRSEHSIRDRLQPRAVLLELSSQPFVVSSYRSHID